MEMKMKMKVSIKQRWGFTRVERDGEEKGLGRLLVGASDDAGEFWGGEEVSCRGFCSSLSFFPKIFWARLTVELHILPYDGALCFILLIHRHHHHAGLPALHLILILTLIDPPPANINNEPLKLPPLQTQPALEHAPLDLATALPHRDRDPHAHQLLEPVDVGDQVGVEVVAVERGPERLVAGLRQEVVEHGEFLHGFGQRRVAGRRERRGARVRGEDVWRQEVQAEREVGRGEDGEGFDEDVGRRFFAREMRVELVAGWEGEVRLAFFFGPWPVRNGAREKQQRWSQIELM